MLDHKIIMGVLPEDGEDFLTELNQLSAQGYVTVATTGAYNAEGKLTMAIIVGRPIANTANQRQGIIMSGGGPKGPQDVNKNATPQQENTGAS